MKVTYYSRTFLVIIFFCFITTLLGNNYSKLSVFENKAKLKIFVNWNCSGYFNFGPPKYKVYIDNNLYFSSINSWDKIHEYLIEDLTPGNHVIEILTKEKNIRLEPPYKYIYTNNLSSNLSLKDGYNVIELDVYFNDYDWDTKFDRKITIHPSKYDYKEGVADVDHKYMDRYGNEQIVRVKAIRDPGFFYSITTYKIYYFNELVYEFELEESWELYGKTVYENSDFKIVFEKGKGFVLIRKDI